MELTDGPAPPPELAIRTFAAAFARREPGATATPEALAVSAYRAQGDELAALLLDLSPGEWDAPTLSGFTRRRARRSPAGHRGVRGVDPRGGPTAGPPPLRSPRRPRKRPPSRHRAHHRRPRGGAPPTTSWPSGGPGWTPTWPTSRPSTRTLSTTGCSCTASTSRCGSMLGARVFEMWTHADDIRRSTGRPLRAPAAPHLAFRSALAVGALPLGLLLAGIDDPGRTVRVVLTGDGGSEFVQPLTVGGTPGTPDATLTADVVDFCRLAAQRLSPAELRHQVEGDADAVRDLLVGAQVFAA